MTESSSADEIGMSGSNSACAPILKRIYGKAVRIYPMEVPNLVGFQVSGSLGSQLSFYSVQTV